VRLKSETVLLTDLIWVHSQSELNLAVSQLLALFVKVIRKLAKTIEDRQKAEIDSSMPAATAQQRIERQPMEQSLNDELAEEAAKVMKGLNAQEEQQSDA
jgi:N-acetyltransferase 10